MRQQNLALLAKWWWRFHEDKDSLWVKVIKGKYRMDHGTWLPQLPESGQVTNIWRDICCIGNISSCIGPLIQEGFRIRVHSGQAVMFWNHTWLGDQAIREAYPRLYLLSSQKNDMVSVVRDGYGHGSWNLQFRRSLRPWEEDEREDLIQRLQSITLDPLKPDSLHWKWEDSGRFSVKSVYEHWERQNSSRDPILGSVWKNLSPPKVEVFLWLAIQDRVATRSVLHSRNMIVDPHLALCPFCSEQTLLSGGLTAGSVNWRSTFGKLACLLPSGPYG